MNTPATPQPLEVLGITADGEIAFRFGDGDEITLSEDDLGVLIREIRRDTLPLWPLQVCAYADADAVGIFEGWPLCVGHATALSDAENASVESERAS